MHQPRAPALLLSARSYALKVAAQPPTWTNLMELIAPLTSGIG